jgi:hypothetical protein
VGRPGRVFGANERRGGPTDHGSRRLGSRVNLFARACARAPPHLTARVLSGCLLNLLKRCSGRTSVPCARGESSLDDSTAVASRSRRKAVTSSSLSLAAVVTWQVGGMRRAQRGRGSVRVVGRFAPCGPHRRQLAPSRWPPRSRSYLLKNGCSPAMLKMDALRRAPAMPPTRAVLEKWTHGGTKLIEKGVQPE